MFTAPAVCPGIKPSEVSVVSLLMGVAPDGDCTLSTFRPKRAEFSN